MSLVLVARGVGRVGVTAWTSPAAQGRVAADHKQCGERGVVACGARGHVYTRRWKSLEAAQLALACAPNAFLRRCSRRKVAWDWQGFLRTFVFPSLQQAGTPVTAQRGRWGHAVVRVPGTNTFRSRDGRLGGARARPVCGPWFNLLEPSLLGIRALRTGALWAAYLPEGLQAERVRRPPATLNRRVRV